MGEGPPSNRAWRITRKGRDAWTRRSGGTAGNSSSGENTEESGNSFTIGPDAPPLDAVSVVDMFEKWDQGQIGKGKLSFRGAMAVVSISEILETPVDVFELFDDIFRIFTDGCKPEIMAKYKGMAVDGASVKMSLYIDRLIMAFKRRLFSKPYKGDRIEW